MQPHTSLENIMVPPSLGQRPYMHPAAYHSAMFGQTARPWIRDYPAVVNALYERVSGQPDEFAAVQQAIQALSAKTDRTEQENGMLLLAKLIDLNKDATTSQVVDLAREHEGLQRQAEVERQRFETGGELNPLEGQGQLGWQRLEAFYGPGQKEQPPQTLTFPLLRQGKAPNAENFRQVSWQFLRESGLTSQRAVDAYNSEHGTQLRFPQG